jgi:siroheme synthase-like protein
LPRRGALVYYPLQLDVRGVPVLVVGGGDVALRKVGSLVESGAQVTLVSPEFHPDFGPLLKRVKSHRRRFKDSDLRGKRLVFAATNVESLNARIAALAKKNGAWVNVAAPPEAGNFVVPSHFRRGPVMVSISTGGASAALARSMRERLEGALGEEWGVAAELLDVRREKILNVVPDPAKRRALLQRLGHAKTAQAIKRSGRAAVAKQMDQLIRAASETNPAPKRTRKKEGG